MTAQSLYSNLFPLQHTAEYSGKTFFQKCSLTSKVEEVALKIVAGLSAAIALGVSGFIFVTSSITLLAGITLIASVATSYFGFSFLKNASCYHDQTLIKQYQQEATYLLKAYKLLNLVNNEGVKKSLHPFSDLCRKHELPNLFKYQIVSWEDFSFGVQMEFDSCDLDHKVQIYKKLSDLCKRRRPAQYGDFLNHLRDQIKSAAFEEFKKLADKKPEAESSYDAFEAMFNYDVIHQKVVKLRKIGIQINSDATELVQAIRSKKKDQLFSSALAVFNSYKQERIALEKEFLQDPLLAEWKALVTQKQRYLLENISILTERLDQKREQIHQKYHAYVEGLNPENAEVKQNILRMKEKDFREVELEETNHVEDFLRVNVNDHLCQLTEKIMKKRKQYEKHLELLSISCREIIDQDYPDLFKDQAIYRPLLNFYERIERLG